MICSNARSAFISVEVGLLKKIFFFFVIEKKKKTMCVLSHFARLYIALIAKLYLDIVPVIS